MILLWENRGFPKEELMRIAVLGAGTIARLVLENARRGALPGVEIIAVAGRAGSQRAPALAQEFSVPLVVGYEALRAAKTWPGCPVVEIRPVERQSM